MSTAAAAPTNDKSSASESEKPSGLRKMRFKHKLILIIFSLLMMAFLRTGFVFFVIGMLPCIVAYYMDISKHRYTFQSIFAANLCGMMPYITKIIAHGPSSTMLQEIMGDSASWVIIYGTAFTGWLLVKICPLLMESMVDKMNKAQLARYESLQKKLEEEWGPEVKQFSGDQPQADH